MTLRQEFIDCGLHFGIHGHLLLTKQLWRNIDRNWQVIFECYVIKYYNDCTFHFTLLYFRHMWEKGGTDHNPFGHQSYPRFLQTYPPWTCFATFIAPTSNAHKHIIHSAAWRVYVGTLDRKRINMIKADQSRSWFPTGDIMMTINTSGVANTASETYGEETGAVFLASLKNQSLNKSRCYSYIISGNNTSISIRPTYASYAMD